MERTFVMLKPDAVERGLVGTVISRLERKGLQLAGMKLIKMSRSQAERLYAEHKGKDFYDKLIDFTTSGKVVVIVVKGENVIAHIRNLMGSTDPAQATPGSIRGDFATNVTRNIIHSCDSPEKAEREIGIFFSEEEIY